MHSRLTAVLSLTGVLVAGSAAALVNTQVLRHTGGESALSADAAIDVSIGIPVVSLTPTVATQPAGSVGAAGVGGTASEKAVAYEVGDAGIVVLDSDSSILTVVSVEAASGWSVIDNHQETATHAHVAFQSGNTVVSFEANLLFGVVGTSVQMYTTSVDGTGTTTAPGGSGSGSGSGGGGSTSTTVAPPATTIDVDVPDVPGVIDDD